MLATILEPILLSLGGTKSWDSGDCPDLSNRSKQFTDIRSIKDLKIFVLNLIELIFKKGALLRSGLHPNSIISQKKKNDSHKRNSDCNTTFLVCKHVKSLLACIVPYTCANVCRREIIQVFISVSVSFGSVGIRSSVILHIYTKV